MTNIQPVNKTDALKVEKIAESMRVDGWVGRPVLVVDKGDYLQALTGSHRIQAAELAGVEVEYVELFSVDDDEVADLVYYLVNEAFDDSDRLATLEQLAEIDSRFTEARDIMIVEEREN